MTRRPVQLTRRHLLACIGAAAAGPAPAIHAQARTPQALAFDVTPAPLRLGPDRDETAIWTLRTEGSPANLRFRHDEMIDLMLHNGLPAPLVLNWHGIDGVPSIEPLTARRPVSPGKTDRYLLPLRQAGTFLCDSRLLGDGLAQPSPARALIVEELTPVEVDRDEVMLIEDWRLDAEGLPMPPGPGGKKVGALLYLVNGKPSFDLTLRTNERLRLRFINACQRNAIALEIQNMDVRIMAIDSQPAEPFLARNGRLVLAPGTRIDAVIDATLPAGTTSAVTLHDGSSRRRIAQLHVSANGPLRPAPLQAPPPLPSGNLPTRLDLKSALRVDMPLTSSGGSSPTSWGPPTQFSTNWPPAFRAKRGRPVVLTLTNPAATPMVFHLHGYHFRLLDRLDDGWKPFWLDTVLVDAGQTQRVAFAADVVGAWLVETMAVEWSAPRQVRWFAVE